MAPHTEYQEMDYDASDESSSSASSELTLREELIEDAALHLTFRGLHPLPPANKSPSPLKRRRPTLPIDFEALARAVRCVICFDVMKDAQILHLSDHCIHRFCKDCITKWLTAESGEPTAVGESYKLVKKTCCPLCSVKANRRMLTPDDSYEKILSLVREFLSTRPKRPTFENSNAAITARLKSLSVRSNTISVEIKAIPGLKHSQLNRSSIQFPTIFVCPPETSIGYVALQLLKERRDNLDESDVDIDVTPFTYPYLITYKRRGSSMYVPLQDMVTVGQVLANYKHDTQELNLTGQRLNLYFAYKIIAPRF